MDVQMLQDTPPWEWPEDAGEEIQETLTSGQADESDRLIAAELAGDLVVMNDEMADSLMAVLGNAAEPAPLRAMAAASLGPVLEHAGTELVDPDEFEDPDSVPVTLDTFRNIQETLRNLYFDNGVPKEVRRRILEASVRAQEDWHRDAVEAAYSSGDREWMLTAVFAMRWVRGFDDQILEALKSPDAEIRSEAVQAAGNWQLDAAWPQVSALAQDSATEKSLLLAAIAAVGSIRPAEAEAILAPLTESDDEEIAEAADEAIQMAEIASSEDDEEDEDYDEDEEDKEGDLK